MAQAQIQMREKPFLVSQNIAKFFQTIPMEIFSLEIITVLTSVMGSAKVHPTDRNCEVISLFFWRKYKF